MPSLEQELAAVKAELSDLRAEYDEYAYIVSHDLSAPLRHVEGFAQMLMDRNEGVLDERSIKHLNMILAASETGQTLLHEMRTYSRLHTRAGAFEPTDSQTAFENAKDLLQDVIEETDAIIQCAPLPTLVADKSQLSMVFYHLLLNALTFNKGQPKIDVNVTSGETASEFIVSDNGIGLDSRLVDKIFKPLRRAVLADEYPGNGMGLANAKKIARRHGGDIWCDTSKTHGAAFHFTISKTLTPLSGV